MFAEKIYVDLGFVVLNLKMIILIFFLLTFLLLLFLLENRRQVASLLKQTNHIKRALYEDELSMNLLELKDIGILSDKEYEEKVRIYHQIKIQENYQANQRILLALREKGVMTEEEFKRKSHVLKDFLEKEEWENSDEILELRRSTGLVNAKCYAEKRESTWMCVCGTENDLSKNNCEGCKLNQQFVLDNYVNK